MPFTPGEANTTALELRQVVADIEHVAAMLPLVPDNKAHGGQLVVTLSSASAELALIAARIQADAGD